MRRKRRNLIRGLILLISLSKVMRNLIAFIFILISSTALSGQYRIISTEKDIYKYCDTSFVYQETIQYDCIFVVDSVKEEILFITENATVKYNIYAITNETSKYTYYVRRNGKRHKIIVDLYADRVKVLYNRNGEYYSVYFKLDKIEVIY